MGIEEATYKWLLIGMDTHMNMENTPGKMEKYKWLLSGTST